MICAAAAGSCGKATTRDDARTLDLCQRVDIDHGAGRAAGLDANRYAKAHQGISLEDFLLAATARAHRCPLWTGNRKHYPIDDVELFAG